MSVYVLYYMASVGLERPWICTQRIMTQLLMLLLYRPIQELPSWLQRMHGKMLSSDVTMSFSFYQVCFSLAASLYFFSPCFNPQCKLCLQYKQLLAMFSPLLMSMPIALISLLQTSLKQRASGVGEGHIGWAWVGTMALATQSDQLMPRMHLGQRWKLLRHHSCLE